MSVVNTSEWPTCNPDTVLKVLRDLKVEMCANGKLFYNSYPKWAALTSAQKNKCKAFWESQSDAVRQGLITKINSLEAALLQDESSRASITNRVDRCRLMHLMVDAEMQATWTRALSPLEREQLDTRDDRKSAYEDLKDAFNDREGRQYQNICIVYENGKPLNPYQAAANMAPIAVTCHDLDPNDSGRPDRDATWVEKHSKEIRGVMSKAYQNYRRSGNQDAENAYLEWCKFVQNVSDVYKYCFVLMPSGLLDQLGRALPEGVQRDTAGCRRTTTGRTYSTTPGAEKRRNQRDKKRKEDEEQQRVFRENPSPDVASVLEAALKQQQRQQALLHFVAHGNEAEKEKAKARLASLAFSDEESE